ncbi:MAG: flagellar M-ring protein FliF [Planctomycetes bacterium]|nr:flagellar M-ring protein FliF [Planctomycetota bacterium]
MEFLRRLGRQLREMWNGLGRVAQIALAAGLVVIVALVAAVAIWSAEPEYRVLFSNLATEDAAAVTARLDEQDIPWRLADDGTTVMVPEDRVEQVRMDLAVEGLPVGPGRGFALFDESSLGMTPFVQNVNYVRAVQDELSRTIMRLEPVSNVRVHIVQPEPTPFIREEKPVTASVTLWTKPEATLSRDQVEGIVKLVAGSVRGLEPENVVILDAWGHALTDRLKPPPEELEALVQWQHQQSVEKHLSDKAQDVLTRAIMPRTSGAGAQGDAGQAIVRVSAEMSFTNAHVTRNEYDPDARVLKHEIVKNLESTTVGGPAGVPGAASNLSPVVPTALSDSDAGRRQEEIVESTYEVSHTLTEARDKEAKIDRLTVAVMLVPPENPHGLKGAAALPISRLDAENLVKQAVGFDETRGDMITVSVATAPEPPPKPEPPPTRTERVEVRIIDFWTVVYIVAGLIALMLAAALLWMWLRPPRARRPELDTLERFSPEQREVLRRVANTLRKWIHK